MADDERLRMVALCAMIAEARAIADGTDKLLAAYLSMAEHRAVAVRDALVGTSRPER